MLLTSLSLAKMVVGIRNEAGGSRGGRVLPWSQRRGNLRKILFPPSSVVPQELQNVLNPSESVALIGRKMTERFLGKQTANFYCFFYSWRRPGNKSGKFIPGFCRKTIKLTKNNKLEKPHEEIRPSSLSQVYSEIYCGSSYAP